MRLARDRQDFVRPHLGITIDGTFGGIRQLLRFMRRHIVDQFSLERFDERLQFTFSVACRAPGEKARSLRHSPKSRGISSCEFRACVAVHRSVQA